MGSLGYVFRNVFQLRTCCRHISVYQGTSKKPKDLTRPNVVRSTLRLDKVNASPMQSLLELSKKYFVPTVNDSELWPKLEEEAVSTIQKVNTCNFDALMMIFLRKNKLYDQGRSFLQYINSVRVPNDITLAHFLILAAESGDEQRAFEAYDRINKSLLVVPTLVELVIKGLSQTSRWKECLQLLGELDEIHIPSMMHLAAAAFTNRDSDTGKQFIQQIMDSGFEPRTRDFYVWITLIYNLKSSEDVYWLACQLLTCLRKNEHILALNTATLLRKTLLKRFSMYASSVTMELKGACPLCGYKLECPKLSPEEHEELKEEFQSRLSKGSESYEQSNPKEMKAFLWFLENAKPYDIVLDGLNVAHWQKNKSPEKLAQQLLIAVTQLGEQGFKPVVLGRKHMWFWNKRIMMQVEAKAKCFYADNISADDPFMIYAALNGGPGTLFLSKDLLRDHHFLLMDQRKKELFHRWAKSCQLYYTMIDGKIEIHHQEQYGIYVQGSWRDGWHIPYEQYEPYKPYVPFRRQKLHWLCANRNRHVKQPSRSDQGEEDLF